MSHVSSGVLLVVGPSGVGKTYLIQSLLNQYPDIFEQVKVYTTRPQRSSECATSDRVFVSLSQFNKMQDDGSFLVCGEFDGCMYGWSGEDLQGAGSNDPDGSNSSSADKILVTNAWPNLLTNFVKIKRVSVVAMSVDPSGKSLLIDRMKLRGASPEEIKKRSIIIDRDMQDIESNKDVILDSGLLFTVTDDSTIEEEVIPWIQKRFNLS